MNETKRRLKMMEDRQKANSCIRELNQIEKTLENGTARARVKAKECLLRNDENNFRLFARTIKYYTNLEANIESIRCQFENYLIQAEMASTFIGLKSVLGKTAKMMDLMPSLKKNNKDFQKFRRSLLKGQISMESFSGMMSDLDPSNDSELTKDELDALSVDLLSSEKSSVSSATVDHAKSDEDFFKELDIH